MIHWFILLVPLGLLIFYSSWQQPYLLYVLLLASLPWSAEISISSMLSIDLPDELLMLAAGFLALVFFIYHRPSVSINRRSIDLLLLLLLHFGWTGITALASDYPVVSFKFFLAKSWYLAAFLFFPFFVLKNEKRIRYAGIFYFISLIAVVLVILFRHLEFDFLFAGINDSVTPFFRNHVNYAAMLVCSLPLAIVMFRLSKSSISGKLLVAISILILLIALILSYSRGAWLALVIGIFAYIMLRYRLLWQCFLLAMFLGVAVFFWLKKEERYLAYAHDYKTTVFHPDFKEQLSASYEIKDISTADRFHRWVAAVRMVKVEPLMGTGPGTFSMVYKPYTIPLFKTWVSDNPEKSTVHNYFLLLLVEQGITGLVIFLLLSFAFFYYAQKLYFTTNNFFYKEIIRAIAVIMAMILTLNFLSDLIETDKIGSLFFTCIALLMIIDKRSAIPPIG
jgi:O-antigen ligase